MVQIGMSEIMFRCFRVVKNGGCAIVFQPVNYETDARKCFIAGDLVIK